MEVLKRIWNPQASLKILAKSKRLSYWLALKERFQFQNTSLNTNKRIWATLPQWAVFILYTATFPVSSSERHIGVHFNSHSQQQIHHNTEQQASIKYRYSFLAIIPYYLSKQPQWRHFVGLNEVKQQVVKNSIIHTWIISSISSFFCITKSSTTRTFKNH